MENKNSESGMALVTVIVVVATLIGSVYYMYDKIKLTTDSVNKIQAQSKNSYAMKGIVAYAKDLLASRVCINPAQQTGMPTFPCSLTDAGSLERLLISRNLNDALCIYYRNNNKPQDGLQNYCEPGRPSLYLQTFNFNIKASNISNQHPLYVLFDNTSDYSLRASCVNIRYDSAASSLHSSVANTTTTVTAYKTESCTGEIVSKGESLDVFYPRQVGEFVLLSNRSISVGNTTAEANVNILDQNKNLIFESPVFINKNFYIPTTGAATNKKIIFNDRVFIGGNFKGIDDSWLSPVFTGSGDLWLSRYPAFEGIQKGVVRTSTERSLTRMFDPALAPLNDAALMDICNKYRNRKLAADFCATPPKTLVKKLAPNKYRFGLTRLNEFVPGSVPGTTPPTGISYADGFPPSEKIKLQVSIGSNSYTQDIHISPETPSGEVNIDLVRVGALRLRNPNNNCLELTSPIRKLCHYDWLKKLTEKTLIYPSLIVESVIDKPSNFNSYEADFVSNDTKYEIRTIDNCRDVPSGGGGGGGGGGSTNEVCDLKVETYNLLETEIKGPQLKVTAKSKLTNKSTIAPQVLDVELYMESWNTSIYRYTNNISNSELNFKLWTSSFCGLLKGVNPLEEIKIDLSTAEFKLITNSSWKTIDGSNASLSTEEEEYLKGEFSYYDMCSVIPPPPTGYASYDADWSAEAFNSWNYNPVDKVNQYKPGPNKMAEYNKIFNVNDLTVLNRIAIDSTTQDLIHSYGILDRCVIRSSATRVKGFFICRYLYIENRSTDLEMIGSFVVDKLEIGAIGNSKIYWKNIYDPSIRARLVGTPKGLKTDAQCAISSTAPRWAGLENRCDPSGLTEMAVPFTWTTFDPLCAISSGAMVSLCKPEERAYNFNVVKIYEGFGI